MLLRVISVNPEPTIIDNHYLDKSCAGAPANTTGRQSIGQIEESDHNCSAALPGL